MNPDPEKHRKRLEDMRDAIEQRLSKIDSNIHHKEEAVEPDFEEQATQRENDETIDALGEAARRELKQIDSALVALDDGRYGVCRDCGKVIAEARLDALPFVLLCVTCAEKAERR